MAAAIVQDGDVNRGIITKEHVYWIESLDLECNEQTLSLKKQKGSDLPFGKFQYLFFRTFFFFERPALNTRPQTLILNSWD